MTLWNRLARGLTRRSGKLAQGTGKTFGLIAQSGVFAGAADFALQVIWVEGF